ncbi:hypothetical protein P4T54_22595 [Bacillus mycoides]|nr:ankyrin [Bacillus mycoides]MED1014273.1 hypothetical protein [Bacillus mycoides]MED1047221.1 hypothetical protein [Bacillus mycoides]MED1052282.1 hypothetical protein [Bacillus mycoides]MED1083272.1 hypothetical protein [Bacillus mycoides]
MAIVEYLFDNGAILDVSDPNRNSLFSAIYDRHLNIVKNGIDITVKYTGDTMKDMGAYEFATERGQKNC